MRSAFVLAAGLGTRLRPITEFAPKPLVPLFNKPLVEFALDALYAQGIRRFAINTHHLPERWRERFGLFDGQTSYRGCEVRLFYEPVLLDTGGGLKNIEPFLRWEGGSLEGVLVFNSDVLCDADLQGLLRWHSEGGFAATLGLRSSGGPQSVNFDEELGEVLDIRGLVGRGGGKPCVFAGIYAVEPEVLEWIPRGQPFSIITAFVEMLRAGRKIGGFLLEDGIWKDLGTFESYLEAHRILQKSDFRLRYDFAYPLQPLPDGWSWRKEWRGFVSIGKGAVVEEGVILEDTVVFDDAIIRQGSRLERCVVLPGSEVRGNFVGQILAKG